MKRGIAFLEEPRREAPIDALHCFDEALELRRRVPADHSPLQGYLLAACLLNRGDALVRMNDVGPVAAALASYDEGVDVLRAAAACRRPALSAPAGAAGSRIAGSRCRLGAATATRTWPPRRLPTRSRCWTRSTRRGIEDRRLRPRRRVAEPGQPARVQASERGARRGARRGACARSTRWPASKPRDPQRGGGGLQARHVLCRVCAHSLSQAGDGTRCPRTCTRPPTPWTTGSRSCASWEQRGGPLVPRRFAFDLFRFGARVYAHYQPQFLEEFIEDNLNPARRPRRHTSRAPRW